MPARAALEPALRRDELGDVGLVEQHRRLRVPREQRSLRDARQEELHHGREALDVRLLVDGEVESGRRRRA